MWMDRNQLEDNIFRYALISMAEKKLFMMQVRSSELPTHIEITLRIEAA
jgi:hypothetical protein